MKLITEIKPRKDGTVTAVVPAIGGAPGANYVFKADASGAVVSEVKDEAHVGYLLDSGNFYPADDDMDAGLEAVRKAQEEKAAAEAAEAEAKAKAEKKAEKKK